MQFKDDDDEEIVSGTLLSIDEELLSVDVGEVDPVCVSVTMDTEFQHLSAIDDDAEAESITFEEFVELAEGELAVEAFGSFEEDCLVAAVIIVET